MFDYINPAWWWYGSGSTECSDSAARNAPDDKKTTDLKSPVGSRDLFDARVNLRAVVNSPKELVAARENLKKVKEMVESKEFPPVNDPTNWDEGSVTRELLEKYGKRW